MTIRELTIDELKEIIEASVHKSISKCQIGSSHAAQIRRLQYVGVAILFGLLLTHPVEVKQVFELLK